MRARRIHSSYDSNGRVANRTSGAFLEGSLEAERARDAAAWEENRNFDWKVEAVRLNWIAPRSYTHAAELLVRGEIFGSDGAEMLEGVGHVCDDEG